MLEAILTTRPATEWMAMMQHLPVGAVRTIDQSLTAPEVLEREMVRSIPEDDHTIEVLGTPFKFTGTDLPDFRPPPLLGQHTDEILAELLSLTPDEIQALHTEGIVT